MEERMTGDAYGTGEVHADITSQPYKGEGMSGKYEAGGDTGGPQGTLEQKATRMQEKASDAIDEAKSRAGAMKDRATEMANQARRRAESLVDDAENAIDRTGLPEKAQNYPLAALAIAFGLGFLMAGRTESRTMAMAKGQVRGMIMGGLAASLKDEAANFAKGQLSGMMGGGSSRTERSGRSRGRIITPSEARGY
jgi:hypothetical protein